MSLSVERLRVSLGGRTVVHDLSFGCAPGTVTALVGPNGAGKSSLLRGIAGLIPAGGTVRLGGHDLSGLSPRARARRVAFLPQGHEVHWPLPVRDVVALGRLPHGASDPLRLPELDRAAVARAVRLADVEALADRPVTRLSGGERARAALARVFAVEAALLLADEPTAALDPQHQLAVMRTLRDAARAGAIVIAATHDLGLAARFADAVLAVKDGRLAAHGAPDRALAPDVLASVFGLAAYRSTFEGEPVLVPWS